MLLKWLLINECSDAYNYALSKALHDLLSVWDILYGSFMKYVILLFNAKDPAYKLFTLSLYLCSLLYKRHWIKKNIYIILILAIANETFKNHVAFSDLKWRGAMSLSMLGDQFQLFIG